MRKAKLLLIAISVFATVGGVLAFEAKRVTLQVFKTTTTTNATGATITICKLLPGFYAIVEIAPLVPSVYTTAVTNTTTIPRTFCSLTLRLGIED